MPTIRERLLSKKTDDRGQWTERVLLFCTRENSDEGTLLIADGPVTEDDIGSHSNALEDWSLAPVPGVGLWVADLILTNAFKACDDGFEPHWEVSYRRPSAYELFRLSRGTSPFFP